MATILIVDDHVLNREFLLTLLGYGGHRLIQASDGMEGLQKVKVERPQLVIADILMPNMDGYEFVARMQRDPATAAIPIIFYTAAYREREATVMAQACGVRWVLHKPSDPELILETVHEALGLPEHAISLPALVSPPAEGMRFSTIDNQLAEYFVELEASSHLLTKIAQNKESASVEQADVETMTEQLVRSLSNLQAVSLRLTALIELGIELSGEREPASLIEIACRVVQHIGVSKYAGIGLLAEDGQSLSHFAGRGLDNEKERLLASISPREGLLGNLLEGRPVIRLSGLSGDPANVGLPPNHPPIHSFLAVPLESRKCIYGWMYLAEKLGSDQFGEIDERVVMTLAGQLVVSYENLLLYEQVQSKHLQLAKEMSERVRLDQDLLRFRMAMNITADAILLLDRDSMRFIDMNDTASRMLSYSREELLALDPRALGTGSLDQLADLFDEISADGKNVGAIEVRLIRKDGSRIPAEIHLQKLRTDQHWIIVMVIRDITERKEAEQRLQHLAHYDPLTGLPNRSLFYETLEIATADAQEANRTIAVLFLDIDRFKNVNDTLGHYIGDALLHQVALRLMKCMRIRDTVGRLGGDEFGVILVLQDGQQDAVNVAQKIGDALRQPFDLSGHVVSVSASIGITIYPNDATDCNTLIRYADTAMYRAKEAGRDSFSFFTSEMNEQALARLDMENALISAIDNNEFLLHYQPKVNITTGRITGVEALIRWERPGHGLIQPGVFIPLLEETGLIQRVGSWVIETACKQISEWLRSPVGPMHVSVNVASRQFMAGSLEEDVLNALKKYGIDPALLELELTESSVMSNVEKTISILSNLKELGVQISIDDFGTGYSSLAYLKRFPIDKLKVDIAFIRDVTTNPDDAAITLAVIKMAHSLKLIVIAEGVETEEQLTFLQRHSCDEIQGYYFSRPVDEQKLQQLIISETHLPVMSENLTGEKQTLLLVDDDPIALTALKHLVGQDGYQVLTAQSAAEGFVLLARHKVQVIVCDQYMPSMLGIEFLHLARDLYPDTLRILLSVNANLQDVMHAINNNVLYRFYTKPWKGSTLRQNIREAFEHYWLLHGVRQN
ncbi:MAG TPA: EAL domain-containing protein [Burkholderiaceae bacterium]|jgi:diguanylate cyclase (GGDEF)-like protein/PAS domain S-box-containing protein